jgi:hypothetical protein
MAGMIVVDDGAGEGTIEGIANDGVAKEGGASDGVATNGLGSEGVGDDKGGLVGGTDDGGAASGTGGTNTAGAAFAVIASSTFSMSAGPGRETPDGGVIHTAAEAGGSTTAARGDPTSGSSGAAQLTHRVDVGSW